MLPVALKVHIPFLPLEPGQSHCDFPVVVFNCTVLCCAGVVVCVSVGRCPWRSTLVGNLVAALLSTYYLRCHFSARRGCSN